MGQLHVRTSTIACNSLMICSAQGTLPSMQMVSYVRTSCIQHTHTLHISTLFLICTPGLCSYVTIQVTILLPVVDTHTISTHCVICTPGLCMLPSSYYLTSCS